MRRPCLAVAALLAAFAPPVAAQPANEPDEIVVEARPEEVIRDFVRDMSDPARTNQLPRWENSVCSGIVGMDPTQAMFVNGRIEAAAGIAGLRLEPAGCRPNILIVFAPDPAALAQGIARHYPITLRRDGQRRLDQFVRTDRPVRWISQTDVETGDGSPRIRGFGGAPDTGRLANSRIQASTRSVMAFILVIVDARRLEPVTLGELGDYLAMVALTRPPLDESPPSQSILSLWEAGAECHGLTGFDRDYLAALYRAPADMRSNAQRSTIGRIMRREGAPTCAQ